MPRSATLWSFVVRGVACGAYALAQQGGPQPPPPPAPGNVGAPANVAAGPGSFSVSAAGDSAVLLEAKSGRTWLLVRSSDRTRPAAWLPIERLDQPEQAAEWDAAQRERNRVLQQNAPLERRLAELRAILADRRARA